MDIEKKKELWDRIESEPESAYRAFESFRNIPSGERKVIAAYRRHTGNPGAAKASDTYSGWSRRFAWRERAAAFDAHLDQVRERSIKRAIEEETERQSREAERIRYRHNEIVARIHDGVIEYMESGEFVENIRPSDVVNVMKVFFMATKHFGESLQQNEQETPDWTPDEQAEFDKALPAPIP